MSYLVDFIESLDSYHCASWQTIMSWLIVCIYRYLPTLARDVPFAGLQVRLLPTWEAERYFLLLIVLHKVSLQFEKTSRLNAAFSIKTEAVVTLRSYLIFACPLDHVLWGYEKSGNIWETKRFSSSNWDPEARIQLSWRAMHGRSCRR